jgi:uncharacterized membrane protein YccC
MLSLLPLLGSIEDRTLVLNSREEASTRIAGICARTARWLEQDDHGEQGADALRAAFDKVRPMLDADAGWVDIAVAGLVIRLRNLVDVVRDCQLLRDAIEDDFNPDSLRFAFTPDMSAAPVLHRDHGLALLAAVSVSLSVLACCGFWITTGWADGVSAPLFAAVLGSLLAGEDDPLPAFRKFYWVFLVVIAVNGIYVFGVFPRITTLEILIVALFPAFLLFGWMAARPGTARIGSMLAIYTSVQLALGSSYSADFSSFANSSIALMLGIALTGVVCGIVRLLGRAGSRVDCSEAIGEHWLRSPEASRTRIASQLPASCSIAWPCSPCGLRLFLTRSGAAPPTFVSFERL